MDINIFLDGYYPISFIFDSDNRWVIVEYSLQYVNKTTTYLRIHTVSYQYIKFTSYKINIKIFYIKNQIMI